MSIVVRTGVIIAIVSVVVRLLWMRFVVGPAIRA